MQCNDFEQVIEQDGPLHLSEAAHNHLAGCPACSGLLRDFTAILSVASEIPSEVEPPTRVWVALRAQLEAEGVIRSPQASAAATSSPRWFGLTHLFSGRMLATAGVAALVLVAGIYQWVRPSGPVPSSRQPSLSMQSFAETANTLDQEEQSLGAMQPAGTFSFAPVDNSLRENLQTVNAFIKECRKRLQEDPNDQMARDYLSAAYQQKAEILAAMMERGRSVN